VFEAPTEIFDLSKQVGSTSGVFDRVLDDPNVDDAPATLLISTSI
jgi:hypothetical protein